MKLKIIEKYFNFNNENITTTTTKNSETSRLDTNLIIELWNKGILWDKIIGYICVPLNDVPFLEQVCNFFLVIFFHVKIFFLAIVFH